jgi:hypothetical protein
MSSQTTPTDKKSQSRTAATIQAVLQRLPLISHVVMLILALYGPTRGQYYVAAVFFTLHIVLVSSQLRTAYGMIRSVTFLFVPYIFAPQFFSKVFPRQALTSFRLLSVDVFTLFALMPKLIGGIITLNSPRKPIPRLSRQSTRLARSPISL